MAFEERVQILSEAEQVEFYGPPAFTSAEWSILAQVTYMQAMSNRSFYTVIHRSNAAR